HHEELKAQIKNGDEIIELNWKRTEQHLVNSNLPIWFAKKNNRPVLEPLIMQDMGEIVTYQDVEKSSAVVYVSKDKLFYGIIDTRFYITRLPFDERLGPNLYIEVGKGHVFTYNDNENENEYNNDSENKNNAENVNENKNNIENEEYHDDITAEFTEDEMGLIYSLLDSVNEKENREHSYENHDEFLSETVAANKINDYENFITNSNDKNEDDYQKYYDDILAELTGDEINAMKSVLDGSNEIRGEKKNDDDIPIKLTEDEANDNEEEYQEYYEDILNKLSENEANVMNSVLDLSNANENKKADGNGDEFNNENLEYYDDILSELTKDKINIVNSIIDSTNTPSISKQSSRDTIQQDVEHNKPSTSAQAIDIGSTPQHNEQRQNKNVGSHHSKSNIFYSEILILVDNNVISKKKNSVKNIQRLILYYIVYFNAIDMLFAKLATNTAVMHVNIAGLEPGAFPDDNSKIDQQDFKNTPQQFYADKMLFKFIKYINTYKKSFPDDSFDFFFLSTNSVLRKSGKIISAHSRSSTDVYAQRRRKTVYTDLLGSVVHYKENYRDYIDATRAIAELLSIEHDPPSEESKINDEQCYSIMQKSQTHCQNYLRWSKRSQNEFNVYFRSNTNRCFLINYPRSLRPFGHPAITMNGRAQCTCYGDRNFMVDRNDQDDDPFNGCHKQLVCTHFKYKMTPLPIDGTPCGDNLVCWEKKCIELVTKIIPDRVPSVPTLKRTLQSETLQTDKAAKKSRMSNSITTIM
ncbi:hypothetical protein PV326_011111, partial [Microctonus aethiopoides]